MQDPEIISGILRNDQHAFKAMVRKYKDLVYNTCYRILQDKSDSEDLSQEVFIEVFRSIIHLKNTEDMSGWIYRIAYCKCISFLRKKNPAKVSGDIDPEITLNNLGNNAQVTDKETPHNSLQQKEANCRLFEEIDKLPENQKKVILMHKFEGYSQKEICEIMGLSVSSVESLIYRAKVALRKSLVDYYENY